VCNRRILLNLLVRLCTIKVVDFIGIWKFLSKFICRLDHFLRILHLLLTSVTASQDQQNQRTMKSLDQSVPNFTRVQVTLFLSHHKVGH